MTNYPTQQYSGLYRALVIDDKDPLFRGRVKVRIPDLMVAGEDHTGKWDENGLWAYPGNNYLGGRNFKDTVGERNKNGANALYQGSCLIPPAGSHVNILFEKNDPSKPIYIGSAEYGQSTVLPENQVGDNPYKKWTLFKSTEGRAIVVSDDPSDARIEITGKKRKISEEPWGDISSVYDIDGNQSVILIDEREGNGKILLKDYKGNYIKLDQESSQLHMYSNGDMHMKTDGSFYLTVQKDFHLKVNGSVYITALEDIMVNATKALKETAESFDRVSSKYDNTKTLNYNVTADSNINMKATIQMFMETLTFVRNTTVTSDTANLMHTTFGGAVVGITAGGPVTVCGSATYIQTAPVLNPLFGAVDTATESKESSESSPNGDRAIELKLIEGAPKYPKKFDTDSLKAHKFKLSQSEKNENDVTSGSKLLDIPQPSIRILPDTSLENSIKDAIDSEMTMYSLDKAKNLCSGHIVEYEDARKKAALEQLDIINAYLYPKV